MPIYEFSCKKCGHTFEHLALSSTEPDPECPECHNKKVEKLISAGVVRPNGIPTGSGGFEPPSCTPTGGG